MAEVKKEFRPEFINRINYLTNTAGFSVCSNTQTTYLSPGEEFYPHFIEALESGTDIGGKLHKMSRYGAGFLEKTREDIEAFISGSGMDFVVEDEFGSLGGLQIERYK